MELRSATADELMHLFPNLTQQSFDHGDACDNPHGYDAFDIFAHNTSDSFYHTTILFYKGIVAGGMINVTDGRRGYALIIGKNYGHPYINNYLSTNATLFWEGIQWAQSNGYECYDLVGQGPEGINQFKRRLGTVAMPFYRIKVMTHPLGEALWRVKHPESIVPSVRRLQSPRK